MTVVVIGGAVALAFATIDPPPLKAKVRVSRAVASSDAALPPIEAPLLPTQQQLTEEAAKLAPSKPAEAESDKKPDPAEAARLEVEALRIKANAGDIPAMEEMGRRLIQGTGMAKDPQAGAGWLVRAAERGSAQSAFNVGVMYERGFVVERDSTKAAQWYRKAADAGVPMAKHNLALQLRDGKGVARDGKAAIELLQSAARQGMAASMFSLGDIYDRGDAAPRDPTAALAWFAITGEFERQANRGEDTQLAKTAGQRVSALQRTLTPEELKQSQEIAQAEFKRIVESLSPPKPVQTVAVQNPAPSSNSAPAASSDTARSPAPRSLVPAAWPGAAGDQVRAIQQALFELGLLRDKPDGGLGPMTRNAIRAYQKSTGLRETGEPSKNLFMALRSALASHDMVANSPLPSPPKEAPSKQAPSQEATGEPPKDTPKESAAAAPASSPAPTKAELPKAEAPKPELARIEIARAEPPPPLGAVDFARTPKATPAAVTDPPKPAVPVIETTKPQPAKVATTAPLRIDIGQPEPPPPPPTSNDLKRLAVRSDPDAWPPSKLDQVKALQVLLRELKFYAGPVDGQLAGGTRAAIREYERLTATRETGEPSQALWTSLKEMRALMTRKPPSPNEWAPTDQAPN